MQLVELVGLVHLILLIDSGLLTKKFTKLKSLNISVTELKPMQAMTILDVVSQGSKLTALNIARNNLLKKIQDYLLRQSSSRKHLRSSFAASHSMWE